MYTFAADLAVALVKSGHHGQCLLSRQYGEALTATVRFLIFGILTVTLTLQPACVNRARSYTILYSTWEVRGSRCGLQVNYRNLPQNSDKLL
jgi:hypothetical protein